MPRATVTSRILKNKDTGLDLFVPSYKETKGMLSSTIHFQVVLVSNLVCFKTPSHRESDVVQYSVEKKLSEFEELRNKIAEEFSGTVLPPINKKSIIVNDSVLKERRNSLDHLLKFLACTAKLSTCAPLLEFLGVDSVRAKKFSHGESLDGVPASVEKSKTNEGAETGASNIPEKNVFEATETDENTDDFFSQGTGLEEINTFTSEDENSVHVQMFEEQDMKRELTEEDEKDFSFVPNAIITKKETVGMEGTLQGHDEEEDNSELFKIDDDLDQLLLMDLGGRKKTTETSTAPSALPETPSAAANVSTERKTSTKPSVPSKPKLRSKPSLPDKPSSCQKAQAESEPSRVERPVPAPRRKINKNSPAAASGNTSGARAEEGGPSTSVTSGGHDGDSTLLDVTGVKDLGQDDIMKYLEVNMSVTEEEADLFS